MDHNNTNTKPSDEPDEGRTAGPGSGNSEPAERSPACASAEAPSATSPQDRGRLASLTNDTLEAEITTLAAHIAAAECRWLELIAEFDRRGAWAGIGVRSCAHWLNWRCGLSRSAARERVRVAHALQRLPLVRAAFAAGQLSYSKVRAITRVANPATETALVEMARKRGRLLRGERTRSSRWPRRPLPGIIAVRLSGPMSSPTSRPGR